MTHSQLSVHKHNNCIFATWSRASADVCCQLQNNLEMEFGCAKVTGAIASRIVLMQVVHLLAITWQAIITCSVLSWMAALCACNAEHRCTTPCIKVLHLHEAFLFSMHCWLQALLAKEDNADYYLQTPTFLD